MTATAWIIGGANVFGLLWVLRAFKRKPAAPGAHHRAWANYKREPLVRDRPEYIKQRIKRYEELKRRQGDV